MKIIKKIIIIALSGIILVTAFIYVLLVVKDFFNGYNESKNLINSEKISLFKDSVKKYITVDKIFTTSKKDSIYVLQYNHNYQIILWHIEQYNNVTADKINLINPTNLKTEDGVFYSQILTRENPDMNIGVKTNLPIKNKLYLCFDKKSSLIDSVKTNKYLYVCARCYDVTITTNKNTYDLFIENDIYTTVDVMFYNSHHNFYIVLLYSPQNSYMSIDYLYNILNINQL